VDQAILVDRDREGGAELLRKLDSSGFPVEAAFWWLDAEVGKWSLLLATPLVDAQGPRAAYQQLIDTVPSDQLPVEVEQVSLVSASHPAVRLLRMAIKTGPRDIASIAFTHNTINGVFVEDAFIYRLSR
jgi:hypothetical protein